MEPLATEFAQHVAIVGGDGQITRPDQLLGGKPGPGAVDHPADHIAAEQQHGSSVAVVGTKAAILFEPSPKLRHHHHRQPVGVIEQIGV